LRGRSGRQGDPGKSRFYLSLQDNLLRIFGGERLTMVMQRIGVEAGTALESKMLSNSIEKAQRKVEAHNFDIRKQLLEYDDVANDQRKVIYRQRDELLSADNISHAINVIRDDVINRAINQSIPEHSLEEQWDVPTLEAQLEKDFNVRLPIHEWLDKEENLHEENLRERILSIFKDAYQKKYAQSGEAVMQQFEKGVMLQTLDLSWREHLAAMDYLRQGIHLRGYAQKNPKQEYKREAYELFVSMLDRINYEVISTLMKFEVRAEQDVENLESQRRHALNVKMEYKHSGSAQSLGHEQQDVAVAEHIMREYPKVGRNEICPCGSGKKFKHCHGIVT
jgi:preprotein translocase subunit SecA